MPDRLFVQKRLSIYNWNPGLPREKEDAIEKRIAGIWHIITLQEASVYKDHVLLSSQFHVTHYGGCAILYNKATFYPNIDVKSIYFHQGWVMQGVLSRASFRRTPPNGRKDCTVLNLHISNIFAKNEVFRGSSSLHSVPL